MEGVVTLLTFRGPVGVWKVVYILVLYTAMAVTVVAALSGTQWAMRIWCTHVRSRHVRGCHNLNLVPRHPGESGNKTIATIPTPLSTARLLPSVSWCTLPYVCSFMVKLARRKQQNKYTHPSTCALILWYAEATRKTGSLVPRFPSFFSGGTRLGNRYTTTHGWHTAWLCYDKCIMQYKIDPWCHVLVL